MASEWARAKASEAWLTHETKQVPFNAKLAEAFADILDSVATSPPPPFFSSSGTCTGR